MSDANPHILIVGAGAVGQVLAYHFAQAGAQVTFLVHRPEYYDALTSRPLQLHQLSMLPFRSGSVLCLPNVNFEVCLSLRDFATKRGAFTKVSAVILTCDAKALRTGDWLPRLLAGVMSPTGNLSRAVLVTTGCDRKLLLAAGLAEDRLVEAGVTFIAWQSPLPGERFTHVHIDIDNPVNPNAPGYKVMQTVAYVLPDDFLFSGRNGGAVRELAAVLSRGGLRSKVVGSVAAHTLPLEAVLNPWLVNLEMHHWSFAKCRKCRKHLAMQAHATAECIEVVVKEVGIGKWSAALLRRLVTPRMLSLLIRIAPLLFPFDLEAYIRYHFVKVREQTGIIVRGFRDAGEAATLQVSQTDQLLAEWDWFMNPESDSDYESDGEDSEDGAEGAPRGSRSTVPMSPVGTQIDEPGVIKRREPSTTFPQRRHRANRVVHDTPLGPWHVFGAYFQKFLWLKKLM